MLMIERRFSLWIAIALVALAGTVMIATQPARADSWHLMLNNVSTASGTNCPTSVASAMDGTDHVFGNFFGSSGITFSYYYGDNDVDDAAPNSVPTSGYSYSNGVYSFDFNTAWSSGWVSGEYFVIHPSSGADFTCTLTYDSP